MTTGAAHAAAGTKKPTDEVAVVTGAPRSIGRVIAQAVAAAAPAARLGTPQDTSVVGGVPGRPRGGSVNGQILLANGGGAI